MLSSRCRASLISSMPRSTRSRTSSPAGATWSRWRPISPCCVISSRRFCARRAEARDAVARHEGLRRASASHRRSGEGTLAARCARQFLLAAGRLFTYASQCARLRLHDLPAADHLRRRDRRGDEHHAGARAYAAIRREEGLPFSYPGGADYLLEAVDARLLARAFAWAAEAPAARNETFNLTNGDVFVWRNVWPAIAAALGVEAGEPEPLRLAEYLPARTDVWRSIAARHGLVEADIGRLVGRSHEYADYCMASLTGRAAAGARQYDQAETGGLRRLHGHGGHVRRVVRPAGREKGSAAGLRRTTDPPARCGAPRT